MQKTLTEKPWLAHYPQEIPESIDYDEQTLQSYLQRAAELYPEKKAFHFMGNEMTYKEVYAEALKLANQLRSLGIEKGDRVSIMLANTPQAVISYYGALLAGGVVVQTNPLYVEREIEHQMIDSGAKIMICLDLVYPRVANVREKTELEHVIVTGIKDFLPFPKNLVYPMIQKKNTGMKVEIAYNEKTHSFNELVKNGSKEPIDLDVDPKNDLALLQYTGGTTGPAKGVMLTHYNLVVNTQQCEKWMYKLVPGEEVIMAALPFFHVYGMTTVMNLSIRLGYKMIIIPKFDPKSILKAIEKHKATLYPGAPTMYIGLLNHPDIKKHDLSSIKACISGSAPLPIEVQSNFEEATNGRLVEGYGLTETSPVAVANLIWGHRKPGSIGLPWPDTDVAILSAETGEPAGPNEVGEIIIRGPQVMKGYWNLPEATQASFREDWFLSGDMGYMDEEGFFYIVDRKKDMIIAGGFNIYPREVEEIFYEHEAVQEICVIGVPDPYRGETVKAFVVLKDGANVTEDQLDEFARKHLASFKVPKMYEFRDELPKTMVGKILRRVLVDEERAKHKETQNGNNK
ncbi:long-chain-fatty-acid--CoA ligase [Salisediminibacterium halotolerans]|uniref:long-chain-fatty-acid--CoA ligase n=1 Tax=Salisediminibacterium halotolerans TaxID=517425 RepID=UPI000EB4B737|nr:long-chain-fatty-acid--CoA ligase [Salisediminibacterium halotolerans]RLJ69434.1 long-chain acyl-CoA synthetase [Actinophytocola xinjiangensis]RPE84060.1 long-chain acyl-CoA synthetase [Salisediminibacterium halotolerans]TWG32509.1 long-chain acyl-CoA synthetase [Salisediminibacterium halotolerans]GEL09046.1 long-chain-fatty-acid--CoA ligase [Salisediminibacterium halotolerans]